MFKFNVSLCEFTLECVIYSSLIAKLIIEFGNFFLSGDQIFIISSSPNSISGYNVIYFLCLWLLRLASFGNLLFFLFANIYGIENERNYNLMRFEVKFQSVFLLVSSIFVVVLVWPEYAIETDLRWMLYMDVYVILAFGFGARELISTSYLIQLGFNVFFFGVIFYRYWQTRPKVKVEKDVNLAITVVGLELVMF